MTTLLPTVRISRSSFSLRMVDLTNAGKRGTCSEIVLYDIDAARDPVIAERLMSTLDAFVSFAKNPVNNYADAASYLREIYETVSRFGVNIDEREIKASKVAPASFQPTKITSSKLEIEVEWDSFTIRDLLDTNNQPTAIPPMKGASTAVKLFRKFVADRKDQITSATYNEVLRAMSAANVGYHHYLAMD